MTFLDDVDSVLGELRTMLIEKNAGYGNSALEPIRIFSKADNLEQIRVRIDDKLSRIMRGNGIIKEDTVFDLMGCLVLMRVAQRRERAAVVLDLEKDESERSRIETDYTVIDDAAIKPPEVCPESLQGLAEQAMNEHIHVNSESKFTREALTVDRFDHDKTQEKSYRALFFHESADGRAWLHYMSASVYTTKDLVLTLPYPMPNGFLKGSGFSANQATALRMYQEYLVTVKEDTEEWKYKKILTTNTRTDYDGGKIEGALE